MISGNTQTLPTLALRSSVVQNQNPNKWKVGNSRNVSPFMTSLYRLSLLSTITKSDKIYKF